MHIIKRDGRRQELTIEKIEKRLVNACRAVVTSDPHVSDREALKPLDEARLDLPALAAEVFSSITKDGTSAESIDNLLEMICESKTVIHPHFSWLAARVHVSALHKATGNTHTFSEVTEKLALENVLDRKYLDNVRWNFENLDEFVDYRLDYLYNYNGLKTLESSYLLRAAGRVVERPQDMLMRVAVAFNLSDPPAAVNTYHALSRHLYTHATPTLFNAGTRCGQLSSCFLLGVEGSGMDHLFSAIHDTSIISSLAGGTGVHLHDLKSNNGALDSEAGGMGGAVSCLKIFDTSLASVSRGGCRRKGAMAYYFPDYHLDVIELLQCRRNVGEEKSRTKELFPAMWVSDEFMKRVASGGDWTLFCPSKYPGLADVYGQEFVDLYTKYEAMPPLHDESGLPKRATIKARALFESILRTKIETGVPYICFKDTINQRSNHKGLGVVKSSNLCTEIVQYSDFNETAVCNLASVAVNRFVLPGSGGEPHGAKYDFDALADTVRLAVRNLDRVIDANKYPTPKSKASNLRSRPIGVGVQGLADAFMELGLPFESEEAARLNRQIFETISYAAFQESCELARQLGRHPAHDASPAARGVLPMDACRLFPKDLSNVGEGVRANFRGTPECLEKFMAEESLYDWQALRTAITEHGLRNSMLLAPMPTASTAQILGNSDSFEPYTSNMFKRQTSAGCFQVSNEHMVRAFEKSGIWGMAAQNNILENGGSVANLAMADQAAKELFKTAWEMKQKAIIDMAADRGMFIDQAQSLNLFMSNPSTVKLGQMINYAWRCGIKTLYYLRTRGSSTPVKFTVDMALATEASLSLDNGAADGERSADETVVPSEVVACPMRRGDAASGAYLDCEACTA
uniref:Ribonucleoside-diphosphate reductase n=1 Tax=Sicyonia whispovirus TaxID=2984283 RepID=A0A9C7F8G0_9VIRU|nr:MAG: wsv172-like protein [Sicyonia whispovirus]